MLKALMALLAVTLVACGHDEQKEVDNLEAEGNQLIQETAKTREQKLNQKINLMGVDTALMSPEDYNWQATFPTAADRTKIRAELNDYRSKMQRILEIVHHKHMKWNGDEAVYSKSSAQAKAYLDSLDRFESGGAPSAPADDQPARSTPAKAKKTKTRTS